MKISPILICDDDAAIHSSIKMRLKNRFPVKSAYHADEALHILKQTPIDILILDIQMRTPDEGLRYIPKFKELNPELEIIVNSGNTQLETVREALKQGANDYISKDMESFELIHTLEQAAEKISSRKKSDQQNFELSTEQKKHLLIGKSQWVRQLLHKIDKIKNSDAHVLILGETGTGKEVIARLLRKTFQDSSLEPFVAIDSSTIQNTMAESILFGHEKGAFTGAEKSTQGIFEQANGGIVYFDEIANMPLEIQAKLLRVLQEKEITRLGSQKTIQLDFRIVAATNKNLDVLAREGLFKDDLLQRLNVIPIQTISLKERAEDIPLLVEHFISKLPHPKNLIRFSDAAIQTLQVYDWPGNIRELANVIAYVSTLMDGNEAEAYDLPPRIQDSQKATVLTSGNPSDRGFYAQVSEYEKSILSDEYSKNDGNISKMASALKMDRSHLHSKLKEYGIHTIKTRS